MVDLIIPLWVPSFEISTVALWLLGVHRAILLEWPSKFGGHMPNSQIGPQGERASGESPVVCMAKTPPAAIIQT